MRLPALTVVTACVFLGACAGGPYAPGSGYGPGSAPPPPVQVNPGGPPPAHPLARSATYACEGLSTVVLTEGTRAAMVTLNSGLELRLNQQPGLGGGRYGQPPNEFRMSGSEGLLQVGDKLFRCRVK